MTKYYYFTNKITNKIYFIKFYQVYFFKLWLVSLKNNIQLSHKNMVTLHIESNNWWKNRVLARYLLFKSKNVHITHLKDERLCSDFTLYTEKKTCSEVDVRPSNSYILSDDEVYIQGKILLESSDLRLYQPKQDLNNNKN